MLPQVASRQRPSPDILEGLGSVLKNFEIHLEFTFEVPVQRV